MPIKRTARASCSGGPYEIIDKYCVLLTRIYLFSFAPRVLEKCQHCRGPSGS